MTTWWKKSRSHQIPVKWLRTAITSLEYEFNSKHVKKAVRVIGGKFVGRAA